MALSPQEKFTKLLEQINYSAPALMKGQVAAVIVHQKSRVWELTLHFPHLLPAEVYQGLFQALRVSFYQLAQAQVALQITADEAPLTQDLLVAYWRPLVQQTFGQAGMAVELAEQTEPQLVGQQVQVPLENEQIKVFMENKFFGPLARAYQRVGFPTFTFRGVVDEAKSQAQIDLVKQKQEAQDAALVKKALAQLQANQAKQAAAQATAPQDGPVVIGKSINPQAEVIAMQEIVEEERSVVVEGYVFSKEIRDLRSGRQLMVLEVTDYTSSIVVKKFSRNQEEEAQFEGLNEGDWIRVRGSVQEDNYMKDLTLNAYDINQISHPARQDQAPADEKRIELHVHSTMSQMDATNSITDYAKQAVKWGMPALAITDHADVQAFPEAFKAAGKIKMLYGVEANVVDDGVPLVYNENHQPLQGQTYVIFDVETTGLSAVYDKVIQLSAVKMKDGEVLDKPRN